MKSFSHLITEAEEEQGNAHRQALARGLKYRGFGYWEDPNTGDVKFKTDKDTDTLVPVEEKPEASLGTKQDRGLLGGGGPGDNPGDLSSAAQMMQPSGGMPGGPGFQPGSGIKGTTVPGEEIAFTTLEWEPGPDGSTCVHSDDPPADVPEDAYVNRSNNMKWRAGPDGTNYSNIDYGELLKDLRSPNLDNFLNRMKMQKAMPHPIGRDENV